ncbi:hypothetical protein PoB_007204400 [Plakobranchus ocellatus]|uniref:Endonuclease/exonuclease/phosphatase domain-containing protein n=1 Tax=Plakobranchus ocellatus TaxID=259542 RepID=A0AAV4DNH8_9GAST|nr:hypothetical protein PoB_007204400 [Plakobranchus ocellatus]
MQSHHPERYYRRTMIDCCYSDNKFWIHNICSPVGGAVAHLVGHNHVRGSRFESHFGPGQISSAPLCPPSSKWIEDLQKNTNRNTVVAGDFNGHTPLWSFSDINNSSDR